MKVLLFSDLHLGIHNNNSIWLDLSMKLAEEMYNTCLAKDIKDIIFLGDFFNDRRSINVKTLDTAMNFINYFEDKGVTLHLIIGNHDCYLKNSITPNSISIFQDKSYVNIVTQAYELDENMTLIGWLQDFGNVKTRCLAGHFGISECITTNDSSVVEYVQKQFEDFELVLSGHFHTPSTYKNICYIGSVFPFTFADVDSPRGYYIFDTNTLKKKFIEFAEAPKYKIIYSDQKYTEADIKGNMVKYIYTTEMKKNDLEKEISLLKSFLPLNFQLDFSRIDEEALSREAGDIDFTSKFDSLDLFKEYINKLKEKDQIPKHLKPKNLKMIIESLVKEMEDPY